LPEPSTAVTVTLKAVPTMAVAGAVTEKLEGPAATLIELVAPVIIVLTMSVAVMVWLPTVLNVAEKVPWPPVSVELAGKAA
jgi:hypothetical protein